MYDVTLEDGLAARCKTENLRSRPPTRSRSPVRERGAKQGICVVCMDAPAELAGRECFHLCICSACHQSLGLLSPTKCAYARCHVVLKAISLMFGDVRGT